MVDDRHGRDHCRLLRQVSLDLDFHSPDGALEPFQQLADLIGQVHALLDQAFAHGDQLAGSKPEHPQALEFRHRRKEDRTPTQTAMNRTGNSGASPVTDLDTISAAPSHPAPLRSAKASRMIGRLLGHNRVTRDPDLTPMSCRHSSGRSWLRMDANGCECHALIRVSRCWTRTLSTSRSGQDTGKLSSTGSKPRIHPISSPQPPLIHPSPPSRARPEGAKRAARLPSVPLPTAATRTRASESRSYRH